VRAVRSPHPNPFLVESKRLRRNQLSPIHRSLACCGRGPVPKGRRAPQLGIRRIEDPHHSRGYREIRSNSEMRKLMNRRSRRKMAFALFVRSRSRTMEISFRITSVPAAWEGLGRRECLSFPLVPAHDGARTCVGHEISACLPCEDVHRHQHQCQCQTPSPVSTIDGKAGKSTDEEIHGLAMGGSRCSALLFSGRSRRGILAYSFADIDVPNGVGKPDSRDDRFEPIWDDSRSRSLRLSARYSSAALNYGSPSPPILQPGRQIRRFRHN